MNSRIVIPTTWRALSLESHTWRNLRDTTGGQLWEWPTSEQFWLQHRRLLEAARRHGLPRNPLSGVAPENLVQAAVREVMKIGAATENEVAKVLPPVDELLP